MDCYCKPQSEGCEDGIVKCLNCKVEVHSKCYQVADINRPFFCEVCILMMHEPLIGTEAGLVEAYITYDEIKNGIFKATIQLEPMQVKRLTDNELFINVFVVTPGMLEAEDKLIDMFMGGKSHRITMGHYNLLSWSNLRPHYKQYQLPKKNIDFPCSFAISPFEGYRRLIITLAIKLNRDEIYKYVKTKTTKSLGNQTISPTLERIINLSKGRQVPEKISMLCPLTMTLMKWPGKGMLCKHARFFCVKNYLDMNLKNNSPNFKWRCSVCKARVFYNELFIDDFMQHYIDKFNQDSDEESNVSQAQENDNNRPDAGMSNSESSANRYCFFVYDFQVYSNTEFEAKFSKIVGKVKLSSHDTQAKSSNDAWDQMIGSSGINPQANPNSTRRQHTTLDYIELSKTSATCTPSRSGKLTPIISIRSIKAGTTATPEVDRTRGVSVEVGPRLCLDDGVPVKPEGGYSGQRRDDMCGEQRVEHVVEKMEVEKTGEKIVPEDIEERECRFVIIEDKNERSGEIGIRDLKPVPNSDIWKTHILMKDPRNEVLLGTILEYRSSLRLVTDQIYLVISKMSRDTPPDIVSLLDFVWLAAIEINELNPSKKAGEILGWFCNLYSEEDKIAELIISFLKKSRIIGPKDIEALLSSDEGVDSIALRHAQFIFGFGIGISLPNNDKSMMTTSPTSFGTLMFKCSFLMNSLYDVQLDRTNEEVTSNYITSERVYGHFILAITKILSAYLAASINSPQKNMLIFIELVGRLNRTGTREIAYYRDKYNLAV